MRTIVVYLDHLGNAFKQPEDLFSAWGVKIEQFKKRLNKGYTFSEALETLVYDTQHLAFGLPTKFYGSRVDYGSFENLALKHDISPNELYVKVIQRGLSLDKAVQESKIKKKRVDIHELEGKNLMVVQITPEQIVKRIFSQQYYTTENTKTRANTEQSRILQEKQRYQFMDTLGNTFVTFQNMCEYWGVSEREAKKLEKLVEKRHWNSMLSKLEQPEEITYTKVYTDHQENEFSTFGDMCLHWGKTQYQVLKRIASMLTQVGEKDEGQILKAALETPTGSIRTEEITHFGLYMQNMKAPSNCKYPQLYIAITYWGIDFNQIKQTTDYPVQSVLRSIQKKIHRTIMDHKGNRYRSLEALQTAYNLNPVILIKRLIEGTSLEDILERVESEHLEQQVGLQGLGCIKKKKPYKKRIQDTDRIESYMERHNIKRYRQLLKMGYTAEEIADTMRIDKQSQ